MRRIRSLTLIVLIFVLIASASNFFRGLLPLSPGVAQAQSAAEPMPASIIGKPLTQCAGFPVAFDVEWLPKVANANILAHNVEIKIDFGDGQSHLAYHPYNQIPYGTAHTYYVPGPYRYNVEINDSVLNSVGKHSNIVLIIDCTLPMKYSDEVQVYKRRDGTKFITGPYVPALFDVMVTPHKSRDIKLETQWGDGASNIVIIPANKKGTIQTVGLSHEYPLGGYTTNVGGVSQHDWDWVPNFSLRYTDGRNELVAKPKSVTTHHMDQFPPTKSTNLQATNITYHHDGLVAGSSAELSWAQSVDNVAVAGYKVFRNNQQIATVTNWNRDSLLFLVKYTDSSLPYPRPNSYTYKVQAYDGAGNHSVFSDEFVLPPATGSMTLSKVYSNPNCGYCTADALAWTPPDGPAPIAYRIYIEAEGDTSDPNPEPPCSAAGTYLVETVAANVYTTRNAPCGLADGYLFGRWVYNFYYVVPVYSWGTGPASNSVYAAYLTYYQDPNGCC